MNRPRGNLSSETSSSLPSPFRCAEIASSMSRLYPASDPSLPVTTAPIQGCLHTTVAASTPLPCFFYSLPRCLEGSGIFLKRFIGILLCSLNEQQCVGLADKTWSPDTDRCRQRGSVVVLCSWAELQQTRLAAPEGTVFTRPWVMQLWITCVCRNSHTPSKDNGPPLQPHLLETGK